MSLEDELQDPDTPHERVEQIWRDVLSDRVGTVDSYRIYAGSMKRLLHMIGEGINQGPNMDTIEWLLKMNIEDANREAAQKGFDHHDAVCARITINMLQAYRRFIKKMVALSNEHDEWHDQHPEADTGEIVSEILIVDLDYEPRKSDPRQN